MNQKQIIESYVNSYNNFDVDGMVEYLTSDISFQNISNGHVNLKTEGVEQFTTQAKATKQYFTKREQTIESWEFNSSKVIIEISYKAILAVEFPNGMKPGDTLNLKGSSEFTFENLKIKSITDIS